MRYRYFFFGLLCYRGEESWSFVVIGICVWIVFLLFIGYFVVGVIILSIKYSEDNIMGIEGKDGYRMWYRVKIK